MNLVENEQIKLTANWLNTLGAGIIVTGVIAPFVATLYGVQGPSQTSRGLLLFLSVIWFAIGSALHLSARQVLKRLRR